MDGAGFVGRSDQVELLSARLEAARAGEPSVVLVEGPPGIGKTTLVHHALGDATGVRVLHAAADAAETDVAWGVVDQLARSLGPTAVEELSLMVALADTAAVGGWLLGQLSDVDDGEVVVVVIDDLPWADSLSIVALTFALRRLRSDRVLALFTARSSDLHVLPQGVHQMLRGPQGHVIRLEGFGTDEVEQLGSLLGVELPAPVLTRLTEQTEGNPLHLTALLDEVPQHLSLVLEGAVGRLRHITEVVDAQLDRHGPSRVTSLLTQPATPGPCSRHPPHTAMGAGWWSRGRRLRGGAGRCPRGGCGPSVSSRPGRRGPRR